MYPEELVKPMREELTNNGFSALYSADDVDAAIATKDGELVHMLERHHIEGRSAQMIAENLVSAYNEFC